MAVPSNQKMADWPNCRASSIGARLLDDDRDAVLAMRAVGRLAGGGDDVRAGGAGGVEECAKPLLVRGVARRLAVRIGGGDHGEVVGEPERAERRTVAVAEFASEVE